MPSYGLSGSHAILQHPVCTDCFASGKSRQCQRPLGMWVEDALGWRVTNCLEALDLILWKRGERCLMEVLIL